MACSMGFGRHASRDVYSPPNSVLLFGGSDHGCGMAETGPCRHPSLYLARSGQAGRCSRLHLGRHASSDASVCIEPHAGDRGIPNALRYRAALGV